jgi:hypothetical protein
MNCLNDSFGRNAVRLLGVLFLVSLLTPRHFASGETVRFAGDSDLVGDSARGERQLAGRNRLHLSPPAPETERF